MLLYSPALILGIIGLAVLHRKAPHFAVTIAGVSFTALVFYSAFGMWRGDTSWGPRFLVPLTPFLLLPAALQMRRWPAAFWTALLIGFAIQLPAVLGIQEPSILSAFHLPIHRNPWEHFWQSDVIAQWGSVLRGNVEMWWMFSPARAIVALTITCIGAVAASRAARLCGRNVPVERHHSR